MIVGMRRSRNGEDRWVPKLSDVHVDASKFKCVLGPVPKEQSVGATGILSVVVEED